MPRTRSISDELLLDGALRVMRKVGPACVSFQAVAAATGLSAPTLVQRFGTKQRMLRAALLRAWDHLDAETAAADARAGEGPAGAVALLVGLSGDYGADDDYAEGLLVLREDFRDPVLRRRGHRWGETLAEALGRRLGGARNPRPDLGRLMAAQWQGAVLWWGFSRKGRLRNAVRRELTEWCAAIGQPVAAPKRRQGRPRARRAARR